MSWVVETPIFYAKRIRHWIVAALGFDANEIVPGLYVGSYSSTTDAVALKRHNITHILTILQNAPANRFPEDFTYKVINAVDDESTNMLEYLPTALQFIDEARANGGGVLVHCHAGMSRSGSVVIALVMRDRQMSFKDAWNFVTEGRSIVRPIEHFRKQLQLFQSMGYKVDQAHPDYIQFWQQHSSNKSDEKLARQKADSQCEEGSVRSSASAVSETKLHETDKPDASMPVSPLPPSSPSPESDPPSSSSPTPSPESPPSSASGTPVPDSISPTPDQNETMCAPETRLTESSPFPVVVH